jgi:hypothetical protein
MQGIRHFTRMQLISLTAMLGLVGTVAIVPWQVVAQQPDAKKSSGQSEKAAGDKSPAAAATSGNADVAKIKQELAGTWIGGHFRDVLELHADGTFERFTRQWNRRYNTVNGVREPTRPEYADNYQNGHWEVSQQKEAGKSADAGRTIDVLKLNIRHEEFNIPIWLESDKNSENYSGHDSGAWYSIERIDDKFLRLTVNGMPEPTVNWTNGEKGPTFETTPTLFFRRQVAEQADPYEPEIPKELRRLFALAQFSPEEAQIFYTGYIDLNGRRGGGRFETPRFASVEDPAVVGLVDRLVAARQHKIGFAELFGLDPQELAAFRELMRLGHGRYSTMVALAKNPDSLSPVELSAIKKTELFREKFSQLQADVFNIESNQQQRASRSSSAQRGEGKLISFLRELDQWLTAHLLKPMLPE